MIRINLLKHMPAPTERLQAMLNPSRSGGFISRRETVLGGLFLLLAFGILGTQLWLSREPEEEPPAEEVVQSPVPGDPQFKMGRDAVNPFAVNKPPASAAEETAATTPPRAAPQPKPQPKAAPAAPKVLAEQVPKPPSGPPAAGETGGLTGIRVTPLENGVDVFLSIKGRPRVRSFRVDNPDRIVFDIPGALLEAPREQHNLRVDSALVTRVRAAQNSIEPPLVRVVLEVPQFPSVENSVSDAGVAIRVRQP